MANYGENILPGYSHTAWQRTNASVSGTNLVCSTGGTATYSRLVTDYTMSKYVRIKCKGCTGSFYLYFYYEDKEDNTFRIHHIVVPNEGLNTVLEPQEGTTNHIYVQVVCASAGTIQPITLEMLALGIRSVTTEYAQNTSPVTPPTENWSTTAPQFSTGKYIWQRVVTTFEDGSVSYSDAMNIQTSTTRAILDMEPYYRLTASNTQTPTYGESYIGYWSTTVPVWSTGRYIWQSTRLHWSDNTYTWTIPVLAKGLNDVNEKTYKVEQALNALDKSLDAQGVFNRLTNNGEIDGLYFETYNGKPRLFVNALKMEVGDIIVREDKSNTSSPILFRAVSNQTGASTPNSVYIAGFTVTKGSMRYNSTFLKDKTYGIYLGTDGITSGNGSHHITITNGRITGGKGNYSEDGYFDIQNYWSSTGETGLRIAGRGGIFLAAPRIGVLGYYSNGDSWTVDVGKTLTLSFSGTIMVVYGYAPDYASHVARFNFSDSSSFNSANSQANNFIYNISQGSGYFYYSFTLYYPNYYSVGFKQGLCIGG